MKQQPEEERGAEKQADIFIAPIGLLLVDAEMVVTENFQNAPLPDLTALGPTRKKNLPLRNSTTSLKVNRGA